MKYIDLWAWTLAPNLLLSFSRETTSAVHVSISTAHIVQGISLFAGPLLVLFGILFALSPFRHLHPMGTFIPVGLFVLFLSTGGAVGAGLQLIITATSGTGVLPLILMGALSSVVLGMLGLCSQVVTHLPSAHLVALGVVLILLGFFTTSIAVAVLLFPSSV